MGRIDASMTSRLRAGARVYDKLDGYGIKDSNDLLKRRNMWSFGRGSWGADPWP
jgi:hypothetical protein